MNLAGIREASGKLQFQNGAGSNGGGEGGATGDVAAAYQHMLGIDVLDVGKEGKMKWESAKRNYEIR